MVYSVDAVSDMLDIPRPTLYRYLREYSIPHLRRAGKISIPEESFDRIREARELHREGLGTESVRRKLREGNDLSVEELAERLDRLYETLESLQENLKPADQASPSQEGVLQTLLEKQDELALTVSRLTGMVENLSKTSSRHQSEALGYSEIIREPGTLPEQRGTLSEIRLGNVRNEGNEPNRDGAAPRVAEDDWANRVAADEESDLTTRLDAGSYPTRVYSRRSERFALFTRRKKKLGVLVRRHRRGALAIVLALMALLVILPVWGLLASNEEVQEQPSIEEQGAEEDSQSASATDESPQATKIPALTGLTLPEADEVIAEAGLELGTVDEISSYTVSAGTVAGQVPGVGTEAEPDTSVDLVISGGPPAAPDNVISETGTGQYPGGGI